MSSYLRRIERMPKRRTLGAIRRMLGLHIGDRLGVKNEKVDKKEPRPARGSRRSKHSEAWIESRKERNVKWFRWIRLRSRQKTNLEV